METPHHVIKRTSKEVEKAVKKQINRQRVYVGTVVDGAIGQTDEALSQMQQNPIPTQHYEDVENREIKKIDNTSYKEEKPIYNETIDFHEEKKGFWGKLLGGLRPKPNSSVQNDKSFDDGLVGEPKPIEPSLHYEPQKEDYQEILDENSFIKPRKESIDLQETENNNEVSNNEIANDNLLDTVEQENSQIAFADEVDKTNLSIDNQQNRQEIEIQESEDNNSKTFVDMPSDSFLDDKEEDVPPQGLQLLLDNISDVENIEENSIFVQSGLINSNELSYESVKETIEDEINDSIEIDEHSNYSIQKEEKITKEENLSLSLLSDKEGTGTSK